MQAPVATPDTTPQAPLQAVGEMVRTCIQCGTCSGSCPNEFAMDYTPRRLWRMVLLGLKDEIFQSKTFALCSSCYCCALRCPRGLPLTEAMEALKQMAARENLRQYRHYVQFYKSFLQSVRRHGRVNEMEAIQGSLPLSRTLDMEACLVSMYSSPRLKSGK